MLSKVLSYAVFPAVAILLGAAIAVWRAPGHSLRSAVQHFAAGTVFSVLAVELLPDLLHRKLPLPTLMGFSLGVAMMLTLKWFSDKQESSSRGGSATGMLTAMGVDVGLDGVLIGLSFAAGAKQGLLLTFGLVLELFFLGVACATTLLGKGKKWTSVARVAALLAVIVLAGASAGAFILNSVTAIYVDALLAFGVAALLYLVTEELLVEAHDGTDTPLQTAMFFVGFIILFMVDMLV